ncbi:MAG TPA: penicillin acylase family protein, partial [Allosphingosinicella sp.]|nr:penicillin acylase family protein [Allosphingosinicella sp.]
MRVSLSGRSPRAHRFALAAILLTSAIASPAAAQQRQRYDVSVVRTTYGIPHITARDQGSLGYGVGYTAGEDNVCVIAEQLVTVRGERAQHFGAGPVTPGAGDGPSNVESDIYHRVTADPSALQRSIGKLSADARALIQGFTAGYNRYLRDTAGKLPAPCGGRPWVRPIDLSDALLLMQGSLMAPVFLRPIAAATPPNTPTAATAPINLPVDRPETALGSNGWA